MPDATTKAFLNSGDKRFMAIVGLLSMLLSTASMIYTATKDAPQNTNAKVIESLDKLTERFGELSDKLSAMDTRLAVTERVAENAEKGADEAKALADKIHQQVLVNLAALNGQAATTNAAVAEIKGYMQAKAEKGAP